MTSHLAALTCSLDPADSCWQYCQPTPEQLAREQALLQAAKRPKLSHASPSTLSACRSASEPQGQPDRLSDTVQLRQQSGEASYVRHSPFVADKEQWVDLDELLFDADLFGSRDAEGKAACPAKAGELEPSLEQSMSDASTTTDEDCVDLLFSNTGPWRDWSLDWPCGATEAAAKEAAPEDVHPLSPSPAAAPTFLRLNHEATAQAINCTLLMPA